MEIQSAVNNPNAVRSIRSALYQAAGLSYTITYERLQKKCTPIITDIELYAILLLIDREEYKKHRIHITAVVVQSRGFRYPLEKVFMEVMKGTLGWEHRNMTVTDIFLLEKARTIEFVQEMNRPKKPTHNLW